jgi:hypothetical protein
VSNPSSASFRPSRRTFLKVGVAAAAALLVVRWLRAPVPLPASSPGFRLPQATRAIFAALIPVLLDGALPGGADAAVARTETLQTIEETIAGLPPAARDELAELFSLLDFTPTRCLVAGVWSPWSDASVQSIAAFLDRWRASRFAILRSGYGALHQIVLGAWYAQPRAWPALGYAGPPSLGSA